MPPEYEDIQALNPDRTFDTFVVGDSNRFAHAACKAIIEKPLGTQYNPLVLYGAGGSGKTHLLTAVGNAVMSADPTTAVCNVSARTYIDDFIESLKVDGKPRSMEPYEACKLLMIDDAEILGGDQRWMADCLELFSVDKQLVIGYCWTPGKKLTLGPWLDRQMRMTGLAADLLPPNFELRLATLKCWLGGGLTMLDEDDILYIAKKVPANFMVMKGVQARIRILGMRRISRKRLRAIMTAL